MTADCLVTSRPYHVCLGFGIRVVYGMGHVISNFGVRLMPKLHLT